MNMPLWWGERFLVLWTAAAVTAAQNTAARAAALTFGQFLDSKGGIEGYPGASDSLKKAENREESPSRTRTV